MPGLGMHMISARHFLNVLHKNSPEFEKAIHHNFMLGQILPGLSPCEPTNCELGYIDVHLFRDPELEDSRYSNGLILIPDLDEALRNLKLHEQPDIATRAYLAGIYFHLCLDKRIFTKYLYNIFKFTEESVIDRHSGRTYSTNDFVSEEDIGIKNLWNCMTYLYWNEIKVEMDRLPRILPPSGFSQYDNARTTKDWKQLMEMDSESPNFSNTAIAIDYAEVREFLSYFAEMMMHDYRLMGLLCP